MPMAFAGRDSDPARVTWTFGLDRLRGAIETLAQAGFILYQTAFLSRPGAGPGGLRSTSGSSCDSGSGNRSVRSDRPRAWLLAELHRARGEILLLGPGRRRRPRQSC